MPAASPQSGRSVLRYRDRSTARAIRTRGRTKDTSADNVIPRNSALDVVHLIREPLSSFISQLAPEEFLRVHRSHVVRIGFNAEIRPMFHGDYELILGDGERLPLSRRYKQLLPATIRKRL